VSLVICAACGIGVPLVVTIVKGPPWMYDSRASITMLLGSQIHPTGLAKANLFEIFLQVAIKCLLASRRTERERSPAIFRLPAGSRRVDIHQADRVEPLQPFIILLRSRSDGQMVAGGWWQVAGIDVP
jgi:hypothetical protein